MMMSPEGHYNEYLKGKAEKQILTAIRSLKQEIGKPKKVIENPSYGEKTVMQPDESTLLWRARLHLERAIVFEYLFHAASMDI